MGKKPLAKIEGSIFLSVGDLAQLLSFSERKIWLMEKEGKMPERVMVGGSVRWRRAEIMKWIDEGCPHRTPATKEHDDVE